MLFAAIAQGLKIERIIATPFFGAVKVHPNRLNTKKQFCLTIAGPASAIPVLALSWVWPDFTPLKFTALLGAIMGVFNILPIIFLDGGKILLTLLEHRLNETEAVFTGLVFTLLSVVILAIAGVNTTF
ncbi:hypothetical protein A2976_03950 [candidate division WWE3 bacterium RIFCSPLOWO2_01_FULL_41_9]|uniref:Peptidase M50 domain-containing protein n=1 Tax=candidate division WWE3 bacterium RIFCSPLOWO2_01_FULL_41_9 TaxID=1802626 RepID=A0A1F4VMH7_UNCKA|nr:MAG: hypothetical protein A2976_03950 [candidate division WWE3 bacterium RIFCSPLOWO2_01_FULL_41_9]